MLARDVIVDVLTPKMAGVNVIGYARNIDPPTTQTVMVRLDTVRPAARVTGASWEVTAALLLIEPSTTPGPSDDNLDALLQDVLHALDAQDVSAVLTWTEAKRAAYAPDGINPTNPMYEVTVTAYITK